MPRIVDHSDFAKLFVALLPECQAVPGQSDAFWNQLEVRAERIKAELQDVDLVKERLSSRLGVGMLQALCLWVGLPETSNRAALAKALGEQLAGNPDAPWSQDILFLLGFVYNRRHDSIETISKSLLP